MKIIKLLHNPGAGEGHPSKDELIDMLAAEGYNCNYLSVKEEGWNRNKLQTEDFVVAAGGDGTVRKAVRFLLDQKKLNSPIPLALLPVGTANNIATALGVRGVQQDVIRSWDLSKTRKYDVSKIKGVAGVNFFIEGFGYGVFPYMVRAMNELKSDSYPEDKLTKSLQCLHTLIPKFPAVYCKIKMDNSVVEGKFLLAEIMNIPGIGPNLNLAPHADPGDGNYDIVLVSEKQRDDFMDYISDRLKGNNDLSFFNTLKAREVSMHCEDNLLHVDDKLYQAKREVDITASILKKPLMFMRSN